MIIAIKSEDGNYTLACDTRRIIGGIKCDELINENLPLFRTETDFNLIIGLPNIDNILLINSLKYILKDPILRTLNQKSIYNNFVKDLLEKLESTRVLKNRPGTETPSTIILAKGDKAFGVEGHCSIYEIGDFEVSGVGAEFAISSLEKSRGEPTLKRIARAFYEASLRTNFVGRTFVTRSTKKDGKSGSFYNEEKILEMYPDLMKILVL